MCREGIAASGKHVNSELEGAVKSFQAALAVLNAAVDSQAGLRARGEHVLCPKNVVGVWSMLALIGMIVIVKPQELECM